eukprot:GHVL01020682.1.p2 GENE.GHVL01020682.1~~GHVL01020682.1.p2  ORF type:complete len:230 (+),score=56.57 GHVL01020682.1:47-736(+)
MINETDIAKEYDKLENTLESLKCSNIPVKIEVNNEGFFEGKTDFLHKLLVSIGYNYFTEMTIDQTHDFLKRRKNYFINNPPAEDPLEITNDQRVPPTNLISESNDQRVPPTNVISESNDLRVPPTMWEKTRSILDKYRHLDNDEEQDANEDADTHIKKMSNIARKINYSEGTVKNTVISETVIEEFSNETAAPLPPILKKGNETCSTSSVRPQRVSKFKQMLIDDREHL